MARASAKPKVAGSGSSRTSTGSGITTQELSELRDMFAVGRSSTRTNQFLTLPSFVPSAPPRPPREIEWKPGNGRTQIVVQMPDGNVIAIETEEVSISFERDFVDASGFSTQKTYLVREGTFTIKGKL